MSAVNNSNSLYYNNTANNRGNSNFVRDVDDVKTLSNVNVINSHSTPLPEFLDASLFQLDLNRERKGLSEFSPVLVQVICNMAYVTMNSENTRFMLALHKLHQSNLDIESFKREIVHLKNVFGLKKIVENGHPTFSKDINIADLNNINLLNGLENLEQAETDAAYQKAYVEVQPHFVTAFQEINRLFWKNINYINNFTHIDPVEAKIILNNYTEESGKTLLGYFKEVEKHLVDLNDTVTSCQTELDRLADLAQGYEKIKPLVTSAKDTLNHLNALMKNPSSEVMDGCQILLTDLPPEKVTLDKLPITSKRAYVLSKDTLFYANKETKQLEKIRLSDDDEVKKAQLKLFKEMIHLPKHLGEVYRNLNKAELTEIPIAIGHIPSDFFKKFMKLANSKMVFCETPLKNLLQEMERSDLKDEIQPLKAVLENLRTHIEQTFYFADFHHIEPRKSIESNHVKNNYSVSEAQIGSDQSRHVKNNYSVSEAEIGSDDSHHVKNNYSVFEMQINENENESD